MEKKNSKGETKLQQAVIKGDAAQAAALLAAGANANVWDNYGWTPLHEAVLTGSDGSVLRVLLNHPSIDLDTIGGYTVQEMGVTPLHDAAANGNTEACKLLVKAGASTRVVDAQGQTPLQAAIAAGQQDTVKFLRSVDQGRKEKAPPQPQVDASSPMQTDDDDDEVEEDEVITYEPPKYETPTHVSKAKAIAATKPPIARAIAGSAASAVVAAPPSRSATVSDAQLGAVRAVLFEAWRRDGDSTSVSAVATELERRRAANTLTSDELESALAALAHDNAVMLTSDGSVLRI